MRLRSSLALAIPLCALLVASATESSAEPADKAKAKPTPAASSTIHPKAKPHHHGKASLDKKKHGLPDLPKLDKSKVLSDAKAATKHVPKPAGKAPAPVAKVPDPSEPPPELTGALPQAKLAYKHKDGKFEAKVEVAGKQDGDAKKSKADKADAHAKDKKADKAKPEKAAGIPVDGKLGKKGPALKACFHPSVTFARLGQPIDVAFPLTTCKGSAAPGAVENLSILARPYTVPAAPLMPTSLLSLPSKGMKATKVISKPTEEIAPGIRRVHPGLVARIQAVANHFPGKTITLVSGYRPASKGSPHASARAFDLRIDGVTNETLVAFCRTLKDTGCGYYPNSYFVHIDVREESTGHVFWIDTSGPGEKPSYVKTWPLPPLPKSAAPVAHAADEDGKKDLDEATKLLEDASKVTAPTTDEAKIGPLEGESDHKHHADE